MVVPYDPDRRKALKVRCLNMSVGRFVRLIEEELARHVDQGRSIEEEAHAVIRNVVRQLASEEFGDSAIFLLDDDTPMGAEEWEPGQDETPEFEDKLLDDEPTPSRGNPTQPAGE